MPTQSLAVVPASNDTLYPTDRKESVTMCCGYGGVDKRVECPSSITCRAAVLRAELVAAAAAGHCLRPARPDA